MEAEQVLIGKTIDEASAEDAARAAVADADPLDHNDYMVHIAKILVKRTVLACRR